MRAGFALQLVTVRWLGTFLEDPLDVPGGVLDFVASQQLGMADPSRVKRYTEREHTRFDHQWEIRKDRGYREFGDAEEEFTQWAAARSRATGDGPKAIFADGLAWLRERKVLLPGVTTLARLVAKVVTDTTRQLWEELAAMPDAVQRRALGRLLDVPPGARLSDLERWRKGPAPRGSGPSLVKYLDRVAEIGGVGLARLGAEARVPPRRMAELSRYGMTASASLIRRHGGARRLATLVATVRRLEAESRLNAMNDRGMGRGAKIVSGTVRNSLHMIDVIFGLDGGDLPEIVVTDTGSYSDVVFGLLELLGISYRPALADLSDQKGWRIKADADYGPLNAFARGRIDTAKIRRNWEDILRVVASIYTGTVRAYDVVTMLQRDGHPTALGEAIAMYGRIFKTLHILSYVDVDETYRRDIKGIRNLQEGRHALARKICHGKKGELYHRYERGLENQLGALGLVLNCAVLWTTVYLDAAVRQLRAQGCPVRDEDMARLSPFVSSHLGVHGTYSFVLPDLAAGAIRQLRDPDAADEDDD